LYSNILKFKHYCIQILLYSNSCIQTLLHTNSLMVKQTYIQTLIYSNSLIFKTHLYSNILIFKHLYLNSYSNTFVLNNPYIKKTFQYFYIQTRLHSNTPVSTKTSNPIRSAILNLRLNNELYMKRSEIERVGRKCRLLNDISCALNYGVKLCHQFNTLPLHPIYICTAL
jgi:hypothetical protein